MEKNSLQIIAGGNPKFTLGKLCITPNAKESLSHDDTLDALRRHAVGDWGNLDFEDKAANEAALQCGGRLFSAYISCSGARFWIITEADRSYTTILLPEDY